MLKSVAIILDGGFVLKKLPQSDVTEKHIYGFALGCIDESKEELFRLFFYHCAPYEEEENHPISGDVVDFKNSTIAQRSRMLLQKLAERNHVAVRKGRLAFRGWTIKKFTMDKLQKQTLSLRKLTRMETAATSDTTSNQSSNQLSADDFVPEFTQKEVDIKIGLDVAWLSSKHIVDKIVLVTGDTDLVPAMKFARREGVQVVIINIISEHTKNNNYLKAALKEHADEIRSVKYVSGKWTIINEN